MAVRTTLSQQRFLDSETATELRQSLLDMMNDKNFNTQSTYTATASDNISFVDKHMRYLCEHPKVDPDQYISNLRLMTRLRSRG